VKLVPEFGTAITSRIFIPTWKMQIMCSEILRTIQKLLSNYRIKI